MDTLRISHLLIIPSSVPHFIQEERIKADVQIDETYRTNKYGSRMLHSISSTNTNVTYTLGYCFMQTATEYDLTWILHTFVEAGIITDPGVIVTDSDQALMYACKAMFKKAEYMLFY